MVCGITTGQGQWAIAEQGYDNLTVFEEMMVDNVNNMCKTMQGISRADHGRFSMPMRAQVNIKAMVWWLRDLSTRGQPIPVAGFTAANLQDAKANMQDGKQADDKNPIDLPGKFTPRNWVGWWESVKNYLKGQKGAANKPLFYIVRNRVAPTTFPDEIT